MQRFIRREILLALVLGSTAVGCSSLRLADQTAFGIWAAERDLWDEAIFRWKKVLAENPASVAAHNNLAVAYEKKGLWEEARREYDLALKLDPQNSWVKANVRKFEDHQAAGKKGSEGKDEKK